MLFLNWKQFNRKQSFVNLFCALADPEVRSGDEASMHSGDSSAWTAASDLRGHRFGKSANQMRGLICVRR